MMKILGLALSLWAIPAVACDWEVEKIIDPMSDDVLCSVTSQTAKIAFTKRGDDPFGVYVKSAYTRHGLTVRVDDHESVYLGHNAYDYGPKLRNTVLPQIAEGERLRVQYDDYPNMQFGEAAICTLPELLAECDS